MLRRDPNGKSNESTIDDVYHRISTILRCAICGLSTSSPVAVCPSGHPFCQQCRPRKRLACSICRKGAQPQPLNIINKISDLLTMSAREGTFEKALRDLFECPVCYKVAKSEDEYEMCKRGHMVCRFCYLMTAYCPLCRERESVRKNKLVDLVIREIRKGYQCRFSEYGCKEICNIFGPVRHEDSCPYRQFCCLVAECKWMGAIDQIQHHGFDNHGELMATNNRIRFPKGTFQVRFGDDSNHPYWLLYNYGENGIDLVVQTHSKAPSRLTAKVTLGDVTGSCVVFTGAAPHMTEDPLDQLMSQDHLEIPSKLIAKYSNCTELCMNVTVTETKLDKRHLWLNPFNFFTAAFILNVFLFSLKQWGIKQKCC